MISARSTKQVLQKGFTLIELLVVLGILGILATALVATIDPFEQLKKANDANVKNAAVEMANASLRYYTTHNAMPWHDPAAGGYSTCGTASVISGSVDGDISQGDGATCVAGLVADGELKAQFATATTITTKLFLNGTAGQSVSVCYQPTSKSQQRDINTAYTMNGAAGTTCKSFTPPGATDCYWCATL